MLSREIVSFLMIALGEGGLAVHRIKFPEGPDRITRKERRHRDKLFRNRDDAGKRAQDDLRRDRFFEGPWLIRIGSLLIAVALSLLITFLYFNHIW
jgi:hypothetical protein